MPEPRASESEIVFETPIDRRGFVILPNLVLMDPALSAEARLMYALFIHYARQKDVAYPGMETVAKVLGVSVRSARSYRQELEKAMLLRTERRGQKSNLYMLLDLDRRVARIKEEGIEREGDRQKTTNQKRRSDRQKTTSLDRQKTTNEVKAVEEDAVVGERARKRVLKISGKPVAKKRWERTEAILAEYNRQAGSKLRLLTSAKQPSVAAQRIYKVLVAYPDVTDDEHTDIIRRTLSSQWWGKTKPGIGVVFGLKVFEDNITRDPAPVRGGGHDPKRDEQARLDREAAERVMREM